MPTGRWARRLRCLLSRLFDFAAVAMAPGPCRSETHTDQMDRTVVPCLDRRTRPAYCTRLKSRSFAFPQRREPRPCAGADHSWSLSRPWGDVSKRKVVVPISVGWVISRRQQESCPVLEVLRKNCVLGAIESLARTITPHQVRLESGTDPADSVCCVSGVQKARATYEALVGARPTRSPCLRRKTNHSCSGVQPPSLRW